MTPSPDLTCTVCARPFASERALSIHAAKAHGMHGTWVHRTEHGPSGRRPLHAVLPQDERPWSPPMPPPDHAHLYASIGRLPIPRHHVKVYACDCGRIVLRVERWFLPLRRA